MLIKKKIFKKYSQLLFLIDNKKLHKPNSKELLLIKELRQNLKLLPQLSLNMNEISSEWYNFVQETLFLLNNSDPREFLRFDVIKKTMFVGNADYIKEELKYLKNNKWKRRKKIIIETRVGCPARFPFYPKSSATLIHQGYHCALFEDKLNVNLTDVEYIFEFGGGYGSLCRLIYNMGFRGKYLILDLPVFSCLQMFFLKMLNIEVGLDTYNDEKNVTCINNVEILNEIVSKIKNKRKMFIATWSISESPVELREKVLEIINNFDLFLIAYQNNFGDNNNIDFFKTYIESHKHIEWQNIHINHIPGNYYLFGKKIAE